MSWSYLHSQYLTTALRRRLKILAKSSSSRTSALARSARVRYPVLSSSSSSSERPPTVWLSSHSSEWGGGPATATLITAESTQRTFWLFMPGHNCLRMILNVRYSVPLLTFTVIYQRKHIKLYKPLLCLIGLQVITWRILLTTNPYTHKFISMQNSLECYWTHRDFTCLQSLQ